MGNIFTLLSPGQSLFIENWSETVLHELYHGTETWLAKNCFVLVSEFGFYSSVFLLSFMCITSFQQLQINNTLLEWQNRSNVSALNTAIVSVLALLGTGGGPKTEGFLEKF